MRRTSIRTSFLALLSLSAAACLEGTDAEVSGGSAERPLPSLPAAGRPDSQEQTHVYWFVELPSPPIAAGGDRKVIGNERDAFRAEAARIGLAYTERMTFEDLWNGFSIKLEPKDRAKLSRMRGVKRVFPVVPVELDLNTATTMTGASIVQSTLGIKGQGIKVGVIDTGIDYHHPDLGGCFGPGCHVAFGYDFVGDAFNSDNPVLVPDNDPDDCGGHGSHVAGIIGADRTLKGVAPKATLGAYRVFGCEGSTLSYVMIKAMDRVKQDGMQVVNISIGAAFAGWKEYPTAVAADNLVSSGVVVVTSGGNSGTGGLYATGAPGLGEKVIATAMFDNTHVTLSSATLSDKSPIGYSNATGAPLAPLSGTFGIAKNGTPATADDACDVNPPPAGSFTGKVALIRRGTCTYYEKARNAEKAGAIAAVFYNNTAGRQTITVAPAVGSPAITIPVVTISEPEGIAINALVNAGGATITWTDTVKSFVNGTANLLNGDSSYGLSATLDLKPDLGAPGGQIYSTYPLEKGGYTSQNGTSMASPHTAGAAALYLQAHPGSTPAEVRAALQNNAEPKLWSANPGSGALDVVHRQGAGMINIEKAVKAPARVMPSKLPLGESEAGPAVRTLTVQNLTNNPIEYTLSHKPAVSTSGGTTFAPVNSATGFATVTFSAPSVVVPPMGTATVDATITANPALADRGLYGGYLVLTATDGGVLRVPYVGLRGDYQSIKAMTPTGSNFPWLTSLSNGTYTLAQSGTPFTMTGGNVPYVLVHFDHHVRLFRITAISRTGVNWGEAYVDDFLPRNSTATGFFSFAWDGTTTQNGLTQVVPNGQYYLKVEVLKALGDENNPAHWETWKSGYLAIVRP